MFLVNRRHPAPVVTHDPFTDMTSSEILNVAHVRVAGVGGLALVAFCMIVAWQFALTAVAMAAGLVGGAAVAWMLMRRRRRTI
jgi:nucleoside permease NupC